jgi:hypothetical protein
MSVSCRSELVVWSAATVFVLDGEAGYRCPGLCWGRSMIARIFAPLAAIVALSLSATTVRSLAPQRVLAVRAEVTSAVFVALGAKLVEWVLAAGGSVGSCKAAPGSRPDKTRPRLGADGGHDRRLAPGPASEPWRAPA